MVVDQFGMIGLLTFIRAAETDPNLVSLALGADLTTLGLNRDRIAEEFSQLERVQLDTVQWAL
mgnify:CR=1 FL=1